MSINSKLEGVVTIIKTGFPLWTVKKSYGARSLSIFLENDSVGDKTIIVNFANAVIQSTEQNWITKSLNINLWFVKKTMDRNHFAKDLTDAIDEFYCNSTIRGSGIAINSNDCYTLAGEFYVYEIDINFNR